MTTDSGTPRTRLIFVRHGRASDIEGRCIGHADVPLSCDGRAEIRALCPAVSKYVVGPIALTSSDLRRTADSASIISAALDVPLSLDASIREVSFGDWDGLAWCDIERDDADRLRVWGEDWMTATPPGGESATMLQARAGRWLQDATSKHPTSEQSIVVVSHAGWIRCALSILLCRPLPTLFDTPIEYAHATVVDLVTGTATLVAENAGPSR